MHALVNSTNNVVASIHMHKREAENKMEQAIRMVPSLAGVLSIQPMKEEFLVWGTQDDLLKTFSTEEEAMDYMDTIRRVDQFAEPKVTQSFSRLLFM